MVSVNCKDKRVCTNKKYCRHYSYSVSSSVAKILQVALNACFVLLNVYHRCTSNRSLLFWKQIVLDAFDVVKRGA